MKYDSEKIKNEVDIVDFIGKHVSLKKQGKNFVGVCPFHQDHKESLNVSPSKQIYKCFACEAKGDVISFAQDFMNVDFQESLKILSGESISGANFSPKQNTVEKSNKPEWKYISPMPSEIPNFEHYKFGKPSKVWKYKSETGAGLGFVCRFDLPDGTKQVIPMVYASNGTTEKFHWMGMDVPRPLYNLDLISQNPNAKIVVVEGEKTADAVQENFDPSETIATCWVGGAQGIKNANWQPLQNRSVTLWPDNDTEQKYGETHMLSGKIKPWNEQPGNMAMLAINELIDSNSVDWIQNPDGLPHKWDAADNEWEFDELEIFIDENTTEVPKIPTPESPKPPKKPQTDQTDERPAFDADYFRFLGYDKDEQSKPVYFFFSYGAKIVIRLSPSSMSKPNLISLAPMNFWEDKFPGNKSKLDLDAVQNWLINTSHKIGPFREKYIRGRGAWIDNEKTIIHTGEHLIVDGEKIKLRSFDSKFVYEIAENMNFGYENQMETNESRQLIEKFKFLKWHREIDPFLIAGWCVIAPFCGVLSWRPHIWMTGSAGAGKSYVLEKMVKNVLGDCALVVQGKTTEPGIRGTLQSDARPVLFDESDVDDPNDKERVQAVVSTARASSYSDGGAIVKGNTSGTSRSYAIRSCFLFSSIGVHLKQQSDRSRFTILSLKANKKKDDLAFKKFDLDFAEFTRNDFAHRLHARTINLMPTILKNSETFADAASYVIGNRRLGDQVGGMLAGAYSLMSEKEISRDDAIKWVEKYSWSEERGLEETRDEMQLLTKIMAENIGLESELGRVDRTIGELIMIGAQKSPQELRVNPNQAKDRLKRIGILVYDGSIIIANQSPNINSIISKTSWSSGYAKVLERLEGTEKIGSRTFAPGIRSRGVKIPFDAMFDADEKK